MRLYLQNEYSDGYVSDGQLWKELVGTYGETALKQAGFSNTAPVGNYMTEIENGAFTGFKTENGVLIPTGGVVGHYQPGKRTNEAKASSINVQSTGTSIEEQLIKLGLSEISPQELMRLVDVGEIIVTQHADGTYILEKGKKKTTNAESALGTDKIAPSDLPNQTASFWDQLHPSQIGFIR